MTDLRDLTSGLETCTPVRTLRTHGVLIVGSDTFFDCESKGPKRTMIELLFERQKEDGVLSIIPTRQKSRLKGVTQSR